MHYIYKFLNNFNNVIYVGITNNIKKRVNQQHFTSRGHLPKECYMDTEMIVYSECLSKDDAKIKERYLINKLSPKYNKQGNNNSSFIFEINDFSWKHISFNKNKFVNEVNLSRLKYSNNTLKNIPNIELNNYKIVTKLGIKFIYYKNNNTPTFNIVRNKHYEINTIKINEQLFFAYNQIANIFESNFFHTSTKIYYLIKDGYIKSEDIIMLEDKDFIKNSINSRIINISGQHLYPAAIQLITLKGVLDYSILCISKEKIEVWQKDKRGRFLTWIKENYDTLSRI